MTYEQGFATGYADFQAGEQSRYRTRDLPTAAVLELPRGMQKAPKIVPPERLDYARGYMDGFCKAESDNH